MTKEEAIKILKDTLYDEKTPTDYLEAVKMGIEALENQKTGHWILPKNDDGTSEIIEYQIRCSECGLVLDTQTYYELKMNNGSNYCCRCGAEMKGENNK